MSCAHNVETDMRGSAAGVRHGEPNLIGVKARTVAQQARMTSQDSYMAVWALRLERLSFPSRKSLP
jgi:hypothetical protein